MDRALRNIWAKTAKSGATGWHPLILHMLDVAASADAILAREPESTRKRMAAILGLEWEEAGAWLLLLVACHDLGKACPGFQCKWENMTGMDSGRSPNTDINHAFVSQIALLDLLHEMEWPEGLAELVSDAVGCHHGHRASPNTLDNLAGDRRAIGRDPWAQARRGLFEALLDIFKPATIPAKRTLNGPDFMLLSGLTSFADWIGSNEDWFPFGSPDDCEDLHKWFRNRRASADQALDAIGWETRTPLSLEPKSFEQVFGLAPRPLQQAVAEALADIREPAILLMEAPMGEGKTEAAFFAHLELQRRFGHRGLYVALPTKATGNAMFKRTLKFLHSQGTDRKLDLQLLHGAKLLNDTYQNLRLSGIHDPATGGDVRAGEWFTNKKRALLSEYGVGTVDQALLTILPVRHNFVRLWGLANRVVVFDEIHAYDAYTGTLLVHLLRWLLALGSSVVLLSATLPPSIRRKLAGVINADFPEQEVEYPRLSVFRPGAVEQKRFEADPARRRILRLQGISSDVPIVRAAMEENLASGGMGLALVNTVQRAQDLYRLFPEGKPLEREGQRVGKRLADGTEVFLFHARFPAERRQKREDQVLEIFGEGGNRSGRKILIATQVAEQSLADTAGADMMGTVEFNSACFYRYAVVDWEKLVRNLQNDTELATKGLRAFLEGFVVAEPTGKQNTFAAHNPPEFVAVSVRRNTAPRNLANAFETAVRVKKDESLTKESAARLSAKAVALDKLYGTSANSRYAVTEDIFGEKFEAKGLGEKRESITTVIDWTLSEVSKER